MILLKKYTNEQISEYIRNTKPIKVIVGKYGKIYILPPIEPPTEETYRNYYNALAPLLTKTKLPKLKKLNSPDLLKVHIDPEIDYCIISHFADGKITRFNMKCYIDNTVNTVFNPLKDKEVFKNTLTILNNNVVWDLSGEGIETDCKIDSWTLYVAKDVTELY